MMKQEEREELEERKGRGTMNKQIRPVDIVVPGYGILTGTFDKAESEAVISMIVLHLQDKSPEEWTPIRLGDFTAWCKTSERFSELMENPVWGHAFLNGLQRVIDKGIFTGWIDGDADSIGVMSEAAIQTLAQSVWCRRRGEE